MIEYIARLFLIIYAIFISLRNYLWVIGFDDQSTDINDLFVMRWSGIHGCIVCFNLILLGLLLPAHKLRSACFSMFILTGGKILLVIITRRFLILGEEKLSSLGLAGHDIVLLASIQMHTIFLCIFACLWGIFVWRGPKPFLGQRNSSVYLHHGQVSTPLTYLSFYYGISFIYDAITHTVPDLAHHFCTYSTLKLFAFFWNDPLRFLIIQYSGIYFIWFAYIFFMVSIHDWAYSQRLAISFIGGLSALARIFLFTSFDPSPPSFYSSELQLIGYPLIEIGFIAITWIFITAHHVVHGQGEDRDHNNEHQKIM